MLEYRGKYRVACEFDQRDLTPIKHDTFIVCLNGGKIYRTEGEELCYYNPIKRHSIIRRIAEMGIMHTTWLDDETEIYFHEDDLELVADIVGVPKSGKDIPPTSKRNLRFMEWYKK